MLTYIANGLSTFGLPSASRGKIFAIKLPKKSYQMGKSTRFMLTSADFRTLPETSRSAPHNPDLIRHKFESFRPKLI